MSRPMMPQDWNDAQGWEAYYKALKAPDDFGQYGSFGPEKLPPFVANLVRAGWKRAWLPGCGISPLPKLLSRFGLDVHATDISPSAIAYQTSNENQPPLPELPPGSPPAGTFTGLVQDFRQPYVESYFDIIFNVKAFQGFPVETMRQVAAVHLRALKPGRHAYFDTMNVQGERRDILEASLVAAGFAVPFYELNRWYRRRLRETNIPHVFILGSPMIPMKGPYADDKAKRDRDTAVLREIQKEYERKAQDEQAREAQRRTETDRTAEVIYSTG